MQQGMKYMQQGIGYIQEIISSGKHTKLVQQGYYYDEEKRQWINADIQRPSRSASDMSKSQQGDEYENRQGIADIQRSSRSVFDMSKPQQQGDEYENRQGIADIQPPSRSVFDMSKPQHGDEYENRQGIADIQRPSRSVFDMSKPEHQGDEYENRQGIADIQRPSRSVFDMSKPQGDEYENGQGIEHIRPTRLDSGISRLPKAQKYENLQGIDSIQRPSRSIPYMNEPHQGDKYENRQGIEYVREKGRSETYYEQKDEKPIEHIQIIVRSSSDDQQLIENNSGGGGGRPYVHSEVDQNQQLMEKKQALKRLAEHVDQQGMGIIDVREMSIWFHDVLQAVENENKLGVGYIIAKERQLLQPGVFQVLQYLDLHGIQNIRYRAQEELKLFTQQYDCIEKHPQAHEKFKDLEVLLRICDAVEMSRSEHLSYNTENRTQPSKKKWFWS